MKRIIHANREDYLSASDSGYRALSRVHNVLRYALDIMYEYEDNIEQILNDPSFFDALIDEVRYTESALQSYSSK